METPKTLQPTWGTYHWLCLLCRSFVIFNFLNRCYLSSRCQYLKSKVDADFSITLLMNSYLQVDCFTFWSVHLFGRLPKWYDVGCETTERSWFSQILVKPVTPIWTDWWSLIYSSWRCCICWKHRMGRLHCVHDVLMCKYYIFSL